MRHVFLLHGLGPVPMTGWSLIPLRLYLVHALGFVVHIIQYPVNTMKVDEMVDYVDREMSAICPRDTNVAVVGQSMGGIVANRLHKKGWNIAKGVYIGSPMHGARMLNWLDARLPTVIRDALYKDPYGFLVEKGKDEMPPHPVRTISMSWPGTEFDGCVHRDEATMDPATHTHLPWADHRTVFANPRLWHHVGAALMADECENKTRNAGAAEVN